jgi:predicted O-methyltransferase YrrM
MGNIKFSNVVVPWGHEIENILQRLTKDTKAYTKNTRLGSDFSRRYPELIDMEFMDITTTKYRKKAPESIFNLRPGVVIIPRNKKFEFHRIF